MFGKLRELMSSGGYTDSLLEEAKSLISNGDYSEALTRLNTCIEIVPEWSAPYRHIAWIYAINNFELDDALKYITKCLNMLSGRSDASADIVAASWNVMGEVFLRKNEFGNAIAALDKSLNLRTPDFVEDPNYSAFFRLGICHSALQNLPSSYSALIKAIELNPDNPYIYSYTGETCNALTSFASATEYYEKAITLASEWDFNYPLQGHSVDEDRKRQFLYTCKVNQGFAYSKLEDDGKCLECNEEAYCIYPNDDTAPINLADLYADKGVKEKAHKFLEKGISLIDRDNDRKLILTLLNFDILQYRERALLLLRKYNKISEDEYENSLQHLKKLRDKNLTIVPSDRQPGIINITGDFIMGSTDKHNFSISGNVTARDIAGSDQNIQGDSIGSGVGSTYVASGQDASELMQELQRLKNEINNAQKANILDEETATSIKKHVDVAISQSSTANPDKGKVLNSIENATDVAKSVSRFVDAAKPITEMLIIAGKLAAQLFV